MCRRRGLERHTQEILTLTSVRLGPRLTAENHHAVLAEARGRSRREIEALVAELAPQRDVPTTVRKLPTLASTPPSTATPGQAAMSAPSEPPLAMAPTPAVFPPTPRPIVQAPAPERYRVQFTIGEATHEKLRRVESLLRREIPNGDPAAIFDRALTLLLEKVEKGKLAATAKPSPRRSIRLGTDKVPSRIPGMEGGT